MEERKEYEIEFNGVKVKLYSYTMTRKGSEIEVLEHDSVMRLGRTLGITFNLEGTKVETQVVGDILCVIARAEAMGMSEGKEINVVEYHEAHSKNLLGVRPQDCYPVRMAFKRAQDKAILELARPVLKDIGLPEHLYADIEFNEEVNTNQYPFVPQQVQNPFIPQQMPAPIFPQPQTLNIQNQGPIAQIPNAVPPQAPIFPQAPTFPQQTNPFLQQQTIQQPMNPQMPEMVAQSQPVIPATQENIQSSQEAFNPFKQQQAPIEAPLETTEAQVEQQPTTIQDIMPNQEIAPTPEIPNFSSPSLPSIPEAEIAGKCIECGNDVEIKEWEFTMGLIKDEKGRCYECAVKKFQEITNE